MTIATIVLTIAGVYVTAYAITRLIVAGLDKAGLVYRPRKD